MFRSKGAQVKIHLVPLHFGTVTFSWLCVTFAQWLSQTSPEEEQQPSYFLSRRLTISFVGEFILESEDRLKNLCCLKAKLKIGV